MDGVAKKGLCGYRKLKSFQVARRVADFETASGFTKRPYRARLRFRG